MTSKAANDFNDEGCKAMSDIADFKNDLNEQCVVRFLRLLWLREIPAV